MVSSEFSNLPASSYKSHGFVVVIIIITTFLNCCQISSVLHNIPAQPWVGRLRRCSWRFYPLPLVRDMNGSCWLLCVVLMPSHSTWSGKRPIISEMGKAAVDLPTQPLVFALNDFRGNERRNSKLMTSHYPDLIPLISRKFASSNKHYPIWVVTRHSYGISLLVPQ